VTTTLHPDGAAGAGHPERTRVLVVDDDDALRDLLSLALRHTGHEVVTAASLLEARNAIVRHQPALLVLDVMLPDGDGIEFCGRLRREGITTPVLFLTARHSTADKVRGLTIGGDDYLAKPFSLEELVARLGVMERRLATALPVRRVLSYADVVLDEDRHVVTRNDTPVALTATEFKLLRYFLMNPELALSKAQILDHVWNYDFDGDANVVETYVSYLRRKLDRHGPPLIHTLRGVGYRCSAH
jgi:two-component system OmpR family response regulator